MVSLRVASMLKIHHQAARSAVLTNKGQHASIVLAGANFGAVTHMQWSRFSGSQPESQLEFKEPAYSITLALCLF